MNPPTYTVELTVTYPASQQGPWTAGDRHLAGRIEIMITRDNEGPEWTSVSEAWDLYYGEVLDAVRLLVDPADLDLRYLEERFDDPEGTMDEWLAFGDYSDDAEVELASALGECALPMLTWTRLDTGRTYQHLMRGSDLSHRGEMLTEYGFDEVDEAMRDLFPWEEMEPILDAADAAEAERQEADRRRRQDDEQERRSRPVAAVAEPDFPACVRCGRSDWVQAVIRGLPGREPLPRHRYRIEGCVPDLWSDTAWWCSSCERGFDDRPRREEVAKTI
jgi:hypothetical protein